MSSTKTDVSYYSKDSNGNTFGIAYTFMIVNAYNAELVSDKNERIRKSDPYPVKNGEYACKAGAFGVVIDNIKLNHDKIEENLRLKVRFLTNKQTDVNGRSWIMEKGYTYAYDQNPGDEYQFAITKAEKYGVKLSEEQKAMGVEETTEDTGIFTIISSLCYVVEEKPVAQTRGMTRGGPTRCLRGSAEDDFLNGYSLGRIGSGSKATTNTTTVDVKEITNSDYKTQVRLYVDDSSSTDIVVKFGQTREELKASSVLPPFRG